MIAPRSSVSRLSSITSNRPIRSSKIKSALPTADAGWRWNCRSGSLRSFSGCSHGRDVVPIQKASMGPRSHDRGNHLKGRKPGSPTWSFNGAAVTCSRKWLREAGRWPDLRASMGPRSHARGNVYAPTSARSLWIASMGPRSHARGNAGDSFLGVLDIDASMGPRSHARGNMPAQGCQAKIEACFNGAAVTCSRK